MRTRKPGLDSRMTRNESPAPDPRSSPPLGPRPYPLPPCPGCPVPTARPPPPQPPLDPQLLLAAAAASVAAARRPSRGDLPPPPPTCPPDTGAGRPLELQPEAPAAVADRAGGAAAGQAPARLGSGAASHCVLTRIRPLSALSPPVACCLSPCLRGSLRLRPGLWPVALSAPLRLSPGNSSGAAPGRRAAGGRAVSADRPAQGGVVAARPGPSGTSARARA
jgi:hypothetical protein